MIHYTIYEKNITNDTIWNNLILISHHKYECLSLRQFLVSRSSIYFFSVFITFDFRLFFAAFRNNGIENNFQIKKK